MPKICVPYLHKLREEVAACRPEMVRVIYEHRCPIVYVRNIPNLAFADIPIFCFALVHVGPKKGRNSFFPMESFHFQLKIVTYPHTD